MTRPPTNSGVSHIHGGVMTVDGMSPLKVIGVVIGSVTLLLTLAGLVWGSAVLITGKADHEDVHRIEMEVSEIKSDVKVIQTRQEMFIRALRPNLLPKE